MVTKAFIKEAATSIYRREGSNAAAEYLAKQAFMGDTDKAGKPYFGHLERVADGVDEPYKAIAYLHDLIEDKPAWSYDDLRDIGFSDFVIDGIDAVTSREDTPEGEKYFDFIVRGSLTPQAIQVKMSDLKDNSNLLRLPYLPKDKDLERQRKYFLSYKYLDDVRIGKTPPGTAFKDWMAKQTIDLQDWTLLKKYSDDTELGAPAGTKPGRKPAP